MSTPIYWRVARELNAPMCGSVGPRIGDGQPVCKILPNHDGRHHPDPEDGWGAGLGWIGV